MNIYLCCGLSGRFCDDNTLCIDIDPKVKPHIIADVRYLPLIPNIKPEVLLMTPPCTFFTLARPYPRPGIGLAFTILGACFEAINYLKPKTWIIENPRNHLQKILGKPKFGLRWKASDITATHLFYSNKKSLKRAQIPHDIIQSLLTGDNQQ